MGARSTGKRPMPPPNADDVATDVKPYIHGLTAVAPVLPPSRPDLLAPPAFGAANHGALIPPTDLDAGLSFAEPLKGAKGSASRAGHIHLKVSATRLADPTQTHATLGTGFEASSLSKLHAVSYTAVIAPSRRRSSARSCAWPTR